MRGNCVGYFRNGALATLAFGSKTTDTIEDEHKFPEYSVYRSIV